MYWTDVSYSVSMLSMEQRTRLKAFCEKNKKDKSEEIQNGRHQRFKELGI